MKSHIVRFLALSALLFCSFAFAESESASGEVMEKCKMGTKPAVPNGRTATEEEMLNAQKGLKAYLADGDAYTACLKQVEAGWGEAVTEEQKAVIVIFHNRAVDEMQSTADLFNQAVRAFKGR